MIGAGTERIKGRAELGRQGSLADHTDTRLQLEREVVRGVDRAVEVVDLEAEIARVKPARGFREQQCDRLKLELFDQRSLKRRHSIRQRPIVKLKPGEDLGLARLAGGREQQIRGAAVQSRRRANGERVAPPDFEGHGDVRKREVQIASVEWRLVGELLLDQLGEVLHRELIDASDQPSRGAARAAGQFDLKINPFAAEHEEALVRARGLPAAGGDLEGYVFEGQPGNAKRLFPGFVQPGVERHVELAAAEVEVRWARKTPGLAVNLDLVDRICGNAKRGVPTGGEVHGDVLQLDDPRRQATAGRIESGVLPQQVSEFRRRQPIDQPCELYGAARGRAGELDVGRDSAVGKFE